MVLIPSVRRYLAPEKGGSAGGSTASPSTAATPANPTKPAKETAANAPTAADNTGDLDDEFLSLLPGGEILRGSADDRTDDDTARPAPGGPGEDDETPGDDVTPADDAQPGDDEAQDDEQGLDDPDAELLAAMTEEGRERFLALRAENQQLKGESDPDAEILSTLSEEAKERFLALRAENQKLKQPEKKPEQEEKKPDAPARAQKPNPLAHVRTEADLDAAEAQAEELQQWCLDHWDGGEIPLAEEGKTRALSGEEVRRLYHAQNERLNKWVPAQRHFIAEERKHSAAAATIYPWLKKADSPEYQTFQSLEKALPELKRLPTWRLILARLMSGHAAEVARAQRKNVVPSETNPAAREKPNPATTRKPTVVPTGGQTGGARPLATNSRRQDAALTNALRAGGSRESIAALLDEVGA